MRIVAGIYRGRTIQPPAGNTTRPTIDRVREALFSSIYSLRGDLSDAIALDAFAGSGALGLEALSRGAQRAYFYDTDSQALNALKKNIASLGAQEHARVFAADILKNPPKNAGVAFDLVLLDPPYSTPPKEVISLLCALRDAHVLADDAVITYEHGAENALCVLREAEADGFELLSQKKYGKTWISILKEAQ